MTNQEKIKAAAVLNLAVEMCKYGMMDRGEIVEILQDVSFDDAVNYLAVDNDTLTNGIKDIIRDIANEIKNNL